VRVVVRFHPDARPGIAAWLARLVQAPTGGVDVAGLHVRELVRQFEASDGVPQDAVITGMSGGRREYLWRYASDTWVRFEVEDVRRSVWTGWERQVLVTAIVADHPG
jgi:hypothetical protein